MKGLFFLGEDVIGNRLIGDMDGEPNVYCLFQEGCWLCGGNLICNEHEIDIRAAHSVPRSASRTARRASESVKPVISFSYELVCS